MSKPPKEIDGAEVLEWTWSGSEPFGRLLYESGAVAAEIYGLAICRYKSDGFVCRFSCDKYWETEQDAKYSSVSEAKDCLPLQYQNVKAQWQRHE